MKKITVILAVLAISSSSFAMTQVGRERAATAAKNAAVAVAKASQIAMGADVTKFDIFVATAEEIKRSDDTSTIEVEVGFDSGRGMKYSEIYVVEASQVGSVKSVVLQEQK